MSDEYPKVIDVDGLSVTVQDAADEARWAAARRPEVGVPVSSPLAVGAGQTGETMTVEASADPLDAIELTDAALNDGHVPEPDEPIRRKSATAGGAKKK